MFYLTTHSTYFYLQLYGIGHIHHLTDRIAHTIAFVTSVVEGRKEMFYLTMHSTHFIYGYMTLDIW